jgi:Protein of unknown function (DUF429)
MTRFMGVDFSGGARPWRPIVARPTVWIATAEKDIRGLRLTELIPVQSLAGDGQPFHRLVNFLAAGDFEVAAIDAPFSLPLAHLPKGGHAELLQKVRALPNGPDRPFPTGASIMALGEAESPKAQAKPLRETEAYWAAQGVNTRSTMWNGPRGGAPFAGACLRLLEQSGRPSWPWDNSQPGVLCEAFPAAQLRHWGLPYQGYSQSTAGQVREAIVGDLQSRIDLSEVHRGILMRNPDALDALISAFAAIAVADNAVTGFHTPLPDGFISVAE